jgi:xanthine dehydrogenase accessory factor
MKLQNLTQSGGAPAEIVFHITDEQGRAKDVKRVFLPPQRLILLGGGHVSHALCGYAADLGFEVVAVDDRPAYANEERFPLASRVLCDGFERAIRELAITPYDYIAVVTRGHRHDALCLRAIFGGSAMPYYLGLIGSRRRTTELFALLKEEGFSPAKIERVHTPIGLPIGAETPKEIAISILAELILMRSKQNVEADDLLELTSGEPELRRVLLENKEPRALAVVVKQAGSTPVPPGAIMLVDQIGGIVGTVGGGCGEHEIVLRALEVLRTGKPELVTLDMTNDVAADEGMVCGGRMTVWIEPVKIE